MDRHLHWVKEFQSRRFAATYSDLLNSKDFGAASRFFLIELYGDKDYALRDAQFARIASALQKYFPASVVETAVALAQLHALTEELDFAMAKACSTVDANRMADESMRYLESWRQVGRPADRTHQLDAVLNVGAELNRLTQIRGLRMMLRMMRGPAKAAGLDALQRFLESGFDTFSEMSGAKNLAEGFLETIANRERTWIGTLTNAPKDLCLRELRASLVT
ncbi:MAG: hypothetical protein H7Y28_04975 [Rhodoferax sp.]|nr:hypothetical protein [Rhodoferax sp.]